MFLCQVNLLNCVCWSSVKAGVMFSYFNANIYSFHRHFYPKYQHNIWPQFVFPLCEIKHMILSLLMQWSPFLFRLLFLMMDGHRLLNPLLSELLLSVRPHRCEWLSTESVFKDFFLFFPAFESSVLLLSWKSLTTIFRYKHTQTHIHILPL